VAWLGEQIAWFHFVGVTAILLGLFFVSRPKKAASR
jgi:drug/metabolite transporter (DMT)-like permease